MAPIKCDPISEKVNWKMKVLCLHARQVGRRAAVANRRAGCHPAPQSILLTFSFRLGLCGGLLARSCLFRRLRRSFRRRLRRGGTFQFALFRRGLFKLLRLLRRMESSPPVLRGFRDGFSPFRAHLSAFEFLRFRFSGIARQHRPEFGKRRIDTRFLRFIAVNGGGNNLRSKFHSWHVSLSHLPHYRNSIRISWAIIKIGIYGTRTGTASLNARSSKTRCRYPSRSTATGRRKIPAGVN